VWAKSDVKNARPAIRESIQEHIATTTPRCYQEFAVSVQRNEKQRWHEQVLESVGWLLDTIRQEPGEALLPVERAATEDLFLLRRSTTS
jgi:hypothetical protein